MVNTPSAHSQPISGEATSQAAPCPPDSDLPENSQENLDARLDHAIEETFPTSDPISVTITKMPIAPEQPNEAAPGFRSQSQGGEGDADQDPAEKLLDQVRDALNDVVETTADTAKNAYREGQRYMQHARERYPEAERYYHESRQAARQQITENPWPWFLLAGAVGYALAWMIHGERRSQSSHLPDYARTRRGYAPHHGNPHEE